MMVRFADLDDRNITSGAVVECGIEHLIDTTVHFYEHDGCAARRPRIGNNRENDDKNWPLS